MFKRCYFLLRIYNLTRSCDLTWRSLHSFFFKITFFDFWIQPAMHRVLHPQGWRIIFLEGPYDIMNLFKYKWRNFLKSRRSRYNDLGCNSNRGYVPNINNSLDQNQFMFVLYTFILENEVMDSYIIDIVI